MKIHPDKSTQSLQLFVHLIMQHPTKEYAYAPIYCFYCYRDYYVKDSKTLANNPSSSVPDVEKIEWPIDLTYPNGVSACSKGGWDV